MGYSLLSEGTEQRRAVRAALVERIGTLEGRAQTMTERPMHIATGWTAIDAALGGGIARAGLHEWWGALPEVRAVLVQLAWNALLHDDRQRAGAHRHVVWVGRAAWPSPAALVRGMRAPIAGMFGQRVPRAWPDARLHDRSLLVDVPAHDTGARLWAIEQAVRCPGICAVIADGRGFDLAATRRLQLAASDTCLLCMRGTEHRTDARRSVLTAGATRWMVERSERTPHVITDRVPWLRMMQERGMVDAGLMTRIPPEPAWRVTLERSKGTSMHISSECSAHVTQAWQWQGTAEAPAPEAAAARRRAKRGERLIADHAARSALELRALKDVDNAEPTAGAITRSRSHDRVTSRGTRWARGNDGRGVA
ncbi:MAG: hypothetical protein DWH86_04020 [Planctomycetota bacterium]|nr:MAG: hypothetical protein DWH86_04020 [Planctomycetota bacterium]